jgi:hypothetical protein
MTRKLMLRNLFLGVAILLLFSSCSHKTTPQTTWIYKDSTVVTYQYRDTLVYIMKDSVVIDSIRVTVDSTGLPQLKPVKVKSKNAYIKVAIKDGRLTAEGGCDSLELRLKQLTVEHNRTLSEKKDTVQVIEKTYVPGFYKFCTYAFILLVCVSIVYIYFKVWGLPKL